MPTDPSGRTRFVSQCEFLAILLTLSASLGSSVARGEDGITDVVKRWKDAAASVRTCELHIQGRDIRPAEDVRSGGTPLDPALKDVTLDFEIDYLWKRPDVERYSRRGLMPSNKGLQQFRRSRVLADDATRVLDEGGEDSHMPYDQYSMEKRSPVHEPALQPIRSLLNVDYAGTSSFFDGLNLKIVAEGEQVGGTECRLAESSEKRGARIWFESAAPNRIRKIELDHLVADRSGVIEYLYRYKGDETRIPPPALGGPVEFPTSWDVSIFAPGGKLRSLIECEVLSAAVNAEFPDSTFELPIPPGAIIGDYRKRPPEFALQLADGTARPLQLNQMGRDALFQLSATVPGSRVENQTLSGTSTDQRPGRTWIIIVNLAVITALVGIRLFSRRRPGGAS